MITNTLGFLLMLIVTSSDFGFDSSNFLLPSVVSQELQNASVLVLANKQDIKNSMSAAEISQCLTLSSITTHSWHVQACCALTGEG